MSDITYKQAVSTCLLHTLPVCREPGDLCTFQDTVSRNVMLHVQVFLERNVVYISPATLPARTANRLTSEL
jgi:hypothetical protein